MFTVGQQIADGTIVVVAVNETTGMVTVEFPRVPSGGNPGDAPLTLTVSPDTTVAELEVLAAAITGH